MRPSCRNSNLSKVFDRSIDAEFTTIRARLVETLDQTLLRTAAGLVAIAAAAAAADQKSAGFVRFGSLLVAAYVLFTASVQLEMARRDIADRLQSFDLVIAGRGSGLADDVRGVLANWREQLRRRVEWMRWSLVATAIAVAIGGLVVGHSIDRKRPSVPANGAAREPSPSMSSPRPVG